MRKFPRGVHQNPMAKSWHEGLNNYIERSPPSADTPYWDPQTQERYALDENPPEGELPGRTVTIPTYPDYREDEIIRRRNEIPDIDSTRKKYLRNGDDGEYYEYDAGIDDEIWYDTSRGTSKPEKAYEFGSTPNYQPIADRGDNMRRREPMRNQMMPEDPGYGRGRYVPENRHKSPDDPMPWDDRAYAESSRRLPRNAPHDVPELGTVMDLADEAGADAEAMVQAGDYEGLLRAAKQADSAATDGGIVALETVASRLGLGSQYGVDYSQPSRGDDYAFGLRDGDYGGPPYRPNRRPGGIGSR